MVPWPLKNSRKKQSDEIRISTEKRSFFIMISLDKQMVEFPCPKCGFYNPIFFKQARLRDVIICRGCKFNIQLDDHLNECRKAEQNFRRTIRRLEETIKDLSLKISL